MTVRVSPISKTAAILLIVLGLFTLVVGLASGVIEVTIAGLGIVVLGLALYRLLYRFTRNLQKEVREKTQAS
jgi:membrane protein implicated in regulation of membrane protease activity